MNFSVAIVGRANVGKSTLFNRLAGRKLALVDDTPGVTRDRRSGEARLVDLKFRMIDTAGLEEKSANTLEGRMRLQTEAAIDEADVTLFVVDAKEGITPLDETLAVILRKKGKPVILIANKSEARNADAGFFDAYRLGFGEPCPISAEHGEGMIDLRDALAETAKGFFVLSNENDEDDLEEAVTDIDVYDDGTKNENEDEGAIESDKPLRIAIVGRPNAGKSTLINEYLGEDRLLTGPEAGITRDSISVEWEWNNRRIKMFDTAGMRKRAKVQEKLEKLSVSDALRAIRFAEVVVIVIDAMNPFEKQDLQIADLVIREGRALVIAFNKWDLVEDNQETLNYLHEEVKRLLPQVRGILAVPISGRLAHGLDKLMQAAIKTHDIWNKRIPTAHLNRWLNLTTARHPPPAVSGRRLKLKYMTQIKSRPPGFMVSCTRPDQLPTSYNRYLINKLREDFDMPAIPIRIHYRAGDNPFKNR